MFALYSAFNCGDIRPPQLRCLLEDCKAAHWYKLLYSLTETATLICLKTFSLCVLLDFSQ